MHQLIVTFLDLIRAEVELTKIRVFELVVVIILLLTGVIILFTAFLFGLASITLALLEIVHPAIAVLITGAIAGFIAMIIMVVAYVKIGRS